MYALIFDEHNLKKPSDEGYPGKPLRFLPDFICRFPGEIH